ncbi:MAG: ABC transporter substrate-binding protein [Alphaproteobacteria bacterium]|nr:ABC transporter substrate-binding protein [Alphaproteobacteria bacterium]
MQFARRSLLLFGGAAAVAGLAGCNSAGGAIRFLLDWTIEPNYTGFLLADERGFFRSRNLNVTIEEGAGGAAVAQQIGVGSPYFAGSGSGGGTAIARSAGVPVKSLGVIFPNISTVIFSRPERPINTPQDLIGKRIGLVAGSVTVNEYRALLRVSGIDRAQITEIGVNADPSSLLAGDVDALIDYAEQLPASLQSQNTPLVTMALSDHGVRLYGLNLIANETALADATRAAEIRAVAEAIYQGYDALRADPAAAVEVYMTRYPEKNRAYVERSINITASLLGQGPVGGQSAEGWQATLETLRSIELVGDNVTVEQVMA